MGQALRGAAGRVRAAKVPQQGQNLKNAERGPPGPAAEAPYAPTAGQDVLGSVPDTGASISSVYPPPTPIEILHLVIGECRISLVSLVRRSRATAG